jgi:ELWxxDGT repeat protein
LFCRNRYQDYDSGKKWCLPNIISGIEGFFSYSLEFCIILIGQMMNPIRILPCKGLLLAIFLLPFMTCYMEPVGYDANPSVYSPSGLSFRDLDSTGDEIEGVLYITPAEDESTVTEYNIYFGSSASKNAMAPVTVTATGATVTHTFGADTPLAGATHIWVCGVGPDGEYGGCRSLDIRDLVVEPVATPWPEVPSGLTLYDGRLYFRARNGTDGHELWYTDGVTTAMVMDSDPGGNGFESLPITIFNNELFFPADDGTVGNELGHYDGTTLEIEDVDPGADSSPEQFAGVSDYLYFYASSDSEFYRYDVATDTVTPTGSGPDVNNPDPSSVRTATYNDQVYLTCELTDGTWELCRVDIPSNEVRLFAELNPGLNSTPEAYTVFNDWLYFVAESGTVGREIHWTNGSTTGVLKDINGGTLNGADILISDEPMTVVNGKLFFRATDGVSGVEPWVSDGTTAGTTLLKDLNPSGPSAPTNDVAIGNRIYFSANGDSDGDMVTEGVEPWVTDGTASGTRMIKDINAGGGSSPGKYCAYGNLVFFRADDGTTGAEPWVTDGTSDGTYRIADINGGVGNSNPKEPVVYDGRLYFVADNGTAENLWVFYFR